MYGAKNVPTRTDQRTESSTKVKDTFRPLYRVVTEQLRRYLVTRELAPGAKLGSLREFAARFDVSTMTVLQAIRILEREGLVNYIRDVGAFVAHTNTSPGGLAPPQAAIAFVTIDFDSVFANRIACGIEEACQRMGWILQVYNARSKPELEIQNLERLRTRGTKGAIILPLSDQANLEALFKLKLAEFPFVLVDRSIPGLKVDVVESNHEQGAYHAVKHLLEHGHRRVFMLTSPASPAVSSLAAREHGYVRALIDHGIEPIRECIIRVDPDQEARGVLAEQPWLGGYEAALPVLKTCKPPFAFFSINAHLGRGLLHACRELNLRVGQDVSVVSFDDAEFLQAFDPAVTVIAQPTVQIGRIAVELLERRIQNGTTARPEDLRLDVELISRQSVAHIT